MEKRGANERWGPPFTGPFQEMNCHKKRLDGDKGKIKQRYEREIKSRFLDRTLMKTHTALQPHARYAHFLFLIFCNEELMLVKQQE